MGIETLEKAARIAAENRESAELKSLRMSQAERYVRGERERISVKIEYKVTDKSGGPQARPSTCYEYIMTERPWSAFIGGHSVSVDGLSWIEWMSQPI
jgi:hypothetical protein